MTDIILKKRGNTFTLRCLGHSEDMRVCSAISVLCFTFSGYAHNIFDVIFIADELKSGECCIKFKSNSDEAYALFDVIEFAFLQLQQSFPDLIKIN